MVSSKDIQDARRSAKRMRAMSACLRCKHGKIKCSDFRPCTSCTYAQIGPSCRGMTTTMKKSIACSAKKILKSGSDSTISSEMKVPDAVTSDNTNIATIQTSTDARVSNSETLSDGLSDPRQQLLARSSSHLPAFSSVLDVVVPSHLAFRAHGLGLVSGGMLAPETAMPAPSRFTAMQSSMTYATDRGSPFHHQLLAPAWPLPPLPPLSHYLSGLCPPCPTDSESPRIDRIPLLLMLAANEYTRAHDYVALHSRP